ncbi:MAG: MerR family transcriptional regulator [Bacillota bacterium]|nr:MerR family transcriptional regulator [Bacillota bacterium]
MREGFRSRDVIRLVGISYRQLDYWDRSGFIKPTLVQANGQGTERLYGFRDLVCLKAAKQLKDMGVSLQKIKRSLAYLREHLPQVVTPLSELVFMTDGRSIFVITDDPVVMVDTLRRGQLVWNINVGQMSGEVCRLVYEEEEPTDQAMEGKSFG